MKAKPFERLKVGELFRDIDGTLLMRTSKSFSDVEAKNITNCTVLIPNKPDDNRGEMVYRARDVYCDTLTDREISEIKLVDMPSENNITIEE